MIDFRPAAGVPEGANGSSTHEADRSPKRKANLCVEAAPPPGFAAGRVSHTGANSHANARTHTEADKGVPHAVALVMH